MLSPKTFVGRWNDKYCEQQNCQVEEIHAVCPKKITIDPRTITQNFIQYTLSGSEDF